MMKKVRLTLFSTTINPKSVNRKYPSVFPITKFGESEKVKPLIYKIFLQQAITRSASSEGAGLLPTPIETKIEVASVFDWEEEKQLSGTQ
jgi:hypothetical protein